MRRIFVAAACLAVTQACLVGRELTLVGEGEGAALASSPASAGDGGAAGDAAGRDASSSAPDAAREDEAPPPGFDLDAAIADKQEAGAQVDGGGPMVDGGAGGCVGRGEVEPNGLRALADPLPVGTMCGSIYRPGDIDKFYFDLGGGGRLRIRFEAQGDAYLFMEGNGVSLESGSGASYDFQSAGEWEIDVRSPSGREQTYRLVRE
jgi:hypothetical protein